MAALCCLGFHTCNRPLTVEDTINGARFSTIPFANGYYRYWLNKPVKLSRPVKCYQMFSTAVTEKHAGALILGATPGVQMKFGMEIRRKDIPAGTTVILKEFFILPPCSGDVEHARQEDYFWKVMIPDPAEHFDLFIGRDKRLFPFPWDFPRAPGKAFNPMDIEKLFLGGEWIVRKAAKSR